MKILKFIILIIFLSLVVYASYRFAENDNKAEDKQNSSEYHGLD